MKRVVALLSIVLVNSCQDGPSPPPLSVPGTLTLSFATARSDDGALLLSISGPGPITSLNSASPGLIVQGAEVDGQYRVVVFGSLNAGPIATFQVSDVNRVASYTASIIEVADRSDRVGPPSSGHAVTVTR